jgi:hypothetical protein
VITPTLPVGEQCSSSYSVKPGRIPEAKGLARGGGSDKRKQSLQEKLMEARMDDHSKPLPALQPSRRIRAASGVQMTTN